MDNFNLSGFINDLAKLSPRQGKNEIKTAKFITKTLEKYGIEYRIQEFATRIPVIKKEYLTADGKKIECKGCSFVSGKIESKDNIVSSLISSQPLINHANINFNPKCKGISLSNFYFAPSLAIKTVDLKKITGSKKLKGEIKVTPFKYTSCNILVGNTTSPKYILFAHYDSIETGVIDNASGVGTLMYMILKYPQILDNSLMVFSGNEELSYDYPIYWGHGFREFENSHKNLLENAEKIFIVDCVGNSKMVLNQDEELVTKGFPLKNLDKLKNKIFFAHGDIDNLMEVYHSNLDTIKTIKEKYLLETAKTITDNMK